MSKAPKILHLHSTFDAGGKELRNVRLINEWGKQVDHAIVSGDLEKRGAAGLIAHAERVDRGWRGTTEADDAAGRVRATGTAVQRASMLCTAE